MAADPGRSPQLPTRLTTDGVAANEENTESSPASLRPAGIARVGDLAAPVPPAATKDSVPAEALTSGPSRWARGGAEAIGTFVLLFGGLGAVLSGLLVSTGGVPGPVVLGLALTVAVLAFGHISGGHFNPAVTLGAAIAGRTRWSHTPFYLLGQLVGGFAATGLLYLVLKGHPQLGSNLPGVFTALSNGFDSHSPTQFPLTSVLLAETIGTALFVAIVLGATARRANAVLSSVAAGLGLLVMLAVTAPISNGGINPVRATVTAVFAEGWAVQQLWVFWAAPLLGGLLAGLVFRSFLPVGPTAAADSARSGATDSAAPGVSATAPAGTTAAGETLPVATVRHDEATTDATTDTASPDSASPDSASPDSEVRDFFDRRGGAS